MARAARRGADAAGGDRAGGGDRRPPRAGCTARGCCCWSARATTAATRCGPARSSPDAGPPSRRLLLSEHAHAEGLAALRRGRRPGRRRGGDAHRPDVRGRRDRRHRRPARAEARGRGGARRSSRACRWSRSTCPPASTSTAAPSTTTHVQADLTVTFGTHKIAHLVDPAAAGVRGGAPRRHRPRPPAGAGRGAAGRATSPRWSRARGRPRRSTPAASSGVRAGSVDLPRRRGAVHLGRRERAGRHGALPRARRPTPSVRATPRSSSPTGGCRPGWSGSGGDADAEQALADALEDGVPTVVDADALQHVARRARATSC